MSKPLIALISPSGGGKSTIASKLEKKYGYTQVKSYTTRPIREDDPNDYLTHTFISFADVEQYSDEIVASNTFNNQFYFATVSQLNANQIYVVDVEGLKQLRENYHEKPIIAIYLDVPSEICAKRMEQRGDSDEAIMQRLQHDADAFAGARELCDFVCDNSTQDKANTVCEFIHMLIEYAR